MKRFMLCALLLSLLSVTALGSTALADEPSEINEETPPEILSETETPADALSETETPADVLPETETPADVLPETEPQLVDEVHIVAYDGDADLNAICACIMFGFGSVCGLLAGSEVVRKWTI